MVDVAILVLRVVLGSVLIPHGVHKFQKMNELNKKWLQEYGFPKGSVVFTGILQVTFGLAIIAGVFSRLTALILVLNMMVATFVSIWKHREVFLSTPDGKGWDINYLLIGALVVLMILGDGKWSLI